MSKSIGIFGGGQLGKFLCESLKKRDLKSVVYDTNEDICSKENATKVFIGDFLNEELLEKFSEEIDIGTYEFENIPCKAFEKVKEKIKFPQGAEILYLSQNRLREKNKAKEIGIKVPKFIKVNNEKILKDQIKDFGLPCILKTTSGGYDGKGQWVIDEEKNIPKELDLNIEYILEEKIKFEKELSCMVMRNIQGEIITFPLAENIHKNGILKISIMPAQVDNKIMNLGKELAVKMAKKLELIGPLAIEFFLKDGELYFNEMAPRPHNSFHSTLDAFEESQFDLHIKSILGEKLIEPKLLKPVVMLNILGEDREKVINKTSDEFKKIYIYEKKEWKKARKMGHINFYGKDIDGLINMAKNF